MGKQLKRGEKGIRRTFSNPQSYFLSRHHPHHPNHKIQHEDTTGVFNSVERTPILFVSEH